MRIKAVHITNFRKIIDAEINMEDNITVIAGANNSGKTSLVELFNAVDNLVEWDTLVAGRQKLTEYAILFVIHRFLF